MQQRANRERTLIHSTQACETGTCVCAQESDGTDFEPLTKAYGNCIVCVAESSAELGPTTLDISVARYNSQSFISKKVFSSLT